MSFYNCPEAWTGRAIAAGVAIVAVTLFVGPYFLLRAHNVASQNAAAQAVAVQAAADAKAAKEPVVVVVPIFSPSAKP